MCTCVCVRINYCCILNWVWSQRSFGISLRKFQFSLSFLRSFQNLISNFLFIWASRLWTRIFWELIFILILCGSIGIHMLEDFYVPYVLSTFKNYGLCERYTRNLLASQYLTFYPIRVVLCVERSWWTLSTLFSYVQIKVIETFCFQNMTRFWNVVSWLHICNISSFNLRLLSGRYLVHVQ